MSHNSLSVCSVLKIRDLVLQSCTMYIGSQNYLNYESLCSIICLYSVLRIRDPNSTTRTFTDPASLSTRFHPSYILIFLSVLFLKLCFKGLCCNISNTYILRSHLTCGVTIEARDL